MTRRALIVLGLGQTVNWGVLYYAFAVLVVPLQRELQVPTWVVTGAFSVALAMAAALAPSVGRWSDRGLGPLVMQAGGVAASLLLIVWPLTSGVLPLYLVWGGLGLCMAATLYEPAFVIVGRACHDPGARLRALAAVTLLGGLASTAFLPLTAFLVGAGGWRGASIALAAVLALSTTFARVFAFRELEPRSTEAVVAAPAFVPAASPRAPARFALVGAVFTFGTLAAAAFTTNLLPALGERGIPPATAALLGGLMGVMQLPGRAMLMHPAVSMTPARLLATGLAVQAAGLALVAIGPSTMTVAAGTGLFALGAGLATLVRPHLVQTLWGTERGGALNGRIARQQQLARAAGPVTVAWAAGVSSYAAVLAVLAAAFVVAGVAVRGAFSEQQGLAVPMRSSP